MSKQEPTYENHLDEREARWFAIYTPYKREKMVCRQLQKKGVRAYLPIQTLVRRYTRKIRKVELPLISCYVFVQITKTEYVRVLETEHVLGFVKFAGNLIAIPEEEIDLLKQVLGEGMEVNVEKQSYHEGDTVEVASGNLVGTRGRLCAIQGKKQFLVDLEFLGYTLQINIDPKLLRKVINGVVI
ncbi:MAG: UpxY family transcription antiterminator [Bacteroidota bacterium]